VVLQTKHAKTLAWLTLGAIAALILGVLPQLQGQTGLSKLNPLASKEPMVADPNRAYARVGSLPGLPFKPASYDANSITAQLAHSSDGVVRLSPGDYSIPVRFY
jgi:hypothetical protein